MESQVETVRSEGSAVVVNGEFFDAAVITAPWPQIQRLLGETPDLTTFEPCLTAFFAYRGSWAGNSRETYARTSAENPLMWAACENHKIGRVNAEETVFIAQASAEFSRENLEAEPGKWAEKLRLELERGWELPSDLLLDQFTHRWRYARNSGITPGADKTFPGGIFVTGDSACESRIEAVWKAGRDTAEEVAHLPEVR